ncbi:oligopeptide ABC transporter, oligopeptide-binding protein [Peptoanaerobacter stomatis]|uniref:Oligopeptide ABC transporter, oligopeptide-binding protein n=1 Tax=Peptoanaerobacter stomatis TaxID=796937 RepID=J5UI50_9FIRM|nr:ABC transporter substrate-binding protein [Peptoanaerobacter stomatis]EJU22704.1 oligopeptide ABC transporter, oligopeptide-binding protein [Peptoanaerobacter stomatis]NWO26060.1 ABC transporter substrate-binding protein [Peptostreptococcaceae bacterium oral taxon 081]
MKRIISIILSFVLSVTLLSACGQSNNNNNSNTAPTKTEKTTQANDGTKETRTVTDMAGRTIELPKEINKIGTLGAVGVLNAFVELMGDGDKICNQMSAGFTKNDQWKMQYEFAPQIAQGPLFETGNRELLIENIISAKPDVCVTMTKETAEMLEKNNIACVYLEWKDVNDVKNAVNLMGEVLNKQDVAEKYIAYFDEKISQATDLIKDLKEEDKKTVLYGNPIEFTQPHVIAEWWIEQAGGLSVTNDGRKDGKLEYTMEDLLKWNPQVMIVGNKKQIKEMKENNNYAGITAVKNGDMHVIPTVAHVWGNRTVEQPLTILWTMYHLYPELMQRETLEQEIKKFYKDFFKYEMSDEQISEIIDR